MGVSSGKFGATVIEVDGSTNGMTRRIMRPVMPPFILVEVIDGGGVVSAQRCSRDVFWREHLEGQGGDADERAAKGRKNANRIVVAVLNGGPGALSGDRLQAERRKHGYEVVPNNYGLHNVYEGQVDVLDRSTGAMTKLEGCGRGIKILDQDAPIAQRRRAAAEELMKVRADRMAQNMSTAQAAAAILQQGQPGQAQGASRETQELLNRMAKLEAELAAAKAQQSAAVAEDDEPAPPTGRKKG